MSEERGCLVGGCAVTCELINTYGLTEVADRYVRQNNDDADVILAIAVQHVGQSVKIWLAAADPEHDVKAKKRVLKKGTAPLVHVHSHLAHYALHSPRTGQRACRRRQDH